MPFSKTISLIKAILIKRRISSGPNKAKVALIWPRMALRPAKMAPRGAQDGSSRAQDELKIPRFVSQ